jgi:hypothetical protein
MRGKDLVGRLEPLCGVLFVALQLGGVAIGSQPMVTVGDSRSKIVDAFAEHAGIGVWVGAYMELASLAAFAVFAAWLFRARRAPLAMAGVVGTSVYIGVTVTSLVVGDVLHYGGTRVFGDDVVVALFYLQSGLYFATWGISAAFLALAPLTGWLRRTALLVAGLQLAAMAAPTAGLAQMPNMLFLVWMVVAGIALARRPERAASPDPVPIAT